MAGTQIRIDYDDREVLQAFGELVQQIAHPKAAFADIGEALLISHDRRWGQGIAPDGTPWAPLSPGYRARKKRNQDKVLVLYGRLRRLHYQADDRGLALGTNSIYGAIHQFGGTINVAARSQQVYFRRYKDGTVGTRFVKKGKSKFAQWSTIGAHDVEIPARPFLGLSADDRTEVLAIYREHLADAIR